MGDSTRRDLHKTEAARRLRAQPTIAENRLWYWLRRKQLAGLRFRRQQSVGPYIVDFFCSAAKLVIELDGGQHYYEETAAYDLARTRWLEAQGYRVLRFPNADVLKDKDMILERIYLAIKDGGVPLPEPPWAVRPSLKGRVNRD